MPDQDTDLQGLEAVLRQPVVPRNWMAQTGAILGGFGAGLGMGNPVLEQFTRQRDQELKGQLELIRVRQAAQRQRFEKEQLAIGLYRDLSNSNSQEGRRIGWQGILDYGTRVFGFPQPQGLADRLALQALSKDDLKSVMGDIIARVPRETTMGSHPSLKAEDYDYATLLSQSDPAKKFYGFQTSAEILKEHTEAQAKVHEQQLKAMGIEGASQEARDAQAYIREHFRVDPWFATTAQVTEARTNAKARKDEHEAWTRHMAGERLAVAKEALELARGRASMAQDKLIIQPLQKQTGILKDIAVLDEIVDRIPNLPKSGATLVGVTAKQWRRAWENPTNPELLAFKTALLPVMIGEVDRGSFDEKGARFKEAFGPQIEILKAMPSADALHAIFRIMKTIIQRKIIDTGQLSKQIPHLDPQFIPLIESILNSVRSPVEEQLMREAE